MTEHLTTYKAAKFAENCIKTAALSYLDDIEKSIAGGMTLNEVQQRIHLLKSDINEYSDHQSQVKIHNIVFGYRYVGGRRLEENLTIIDLFDTMKKFFAIKEIQKLVADFPKSNGKIESFFDASSCSSKKNTIYISLYADEVNVNCLVGSFYFL